MEIKIRKGEAADVPAIMKLVRELAEFEKVADQVTNNVEMMVKDGFGENPAFGSFVAEADGHVCGISVYYIRYSTWKGCRLYLEDIVVTAEMRGKGLGKLLFEATVNEAKSLNCTGMMWQVLNWNQNAIDFYAKYDTRFDEEWVNCHLEF